MGKGQRAREARAGKREEMKKAAAKKVRREKITKAVTTVVSILVVAAIVLGIAYSTVASTGFFLRNAVALSTDNYKVDNAMMTYYTKTIYYQMQSYFSSMIDNTKSLDSQSYGDGTWLDYFVGQAQNEAEDMILAAEKAKEAGVTLSDEGKKSIDDNIASMKTDAKNNNVGFGTYLTKVYGEGVKEKDVRRAMELSMLASEYQEKFNEENKEYTDDEINTYFEENKSNYVKAEYLKYSFTSKNSDKEAAKAESKAFADKLAAAKTPEEFETMLKTMLTDHFVSVSEKTDEAEKAEDAKTNVETEMKSINSSAFYPSEEESKQSELTKWLFNKDTTIGMTMVTAPEKDTDTAYTVYMMTKPQYRDETLAGTVRHIYFEIGEDDKEEDIKKKADDVLAEYNAGEKTEKSFIELVTKHSEAANAKETEGLLENVMNDGNGSYPEAFIEWACNAERKAGDVEVIKSDLGYHVIYFVKAGEPAWKISVEQDHLSHDWVHHLEEAAEAHKVTINEKKLKAIKG